MNGLEKFSLMVAADSMEHLAGVLLPFCSYGNIDDEHMVFEDCEKRWLEEYEENNIDVRVTAGGELALPGSIARRRTDSMGCDEFHGGARVSAPLREVYLTFEAYVSAWYCQAARPFGFVRNPNAKWDEWAVGEGADGGLLLLRAEGVPKKLGVECVRRCSWARSSEIAWDEMREAHVSTALARYDEIVSSIQALRVTDGLSELDRKRLHLLENIKIGGRAIDKCERSEWGRWVWTEAMTDAFLDQNGMWVDRHTTEGVNGEGSIGPGYDEDFWQFAEGVPSMQNMYLVQCYRDHSG